jgi:predicted phosphoribosyltransferase
MANNLIFRDRIDAGCQLAAHPELQKIKSLPSNEKDSYLVISLPRGGTVVGDELAKQLGLTHDLVFPRKIPCPGQPEFAIGAVSELGDVIWNDYAIEENLIDKSNVQKNKDKQIQEAKRRKEIYRGQRKPLESLNGKIAILVDDGLATGI